MLVSPLSGYWRLEAQVSLLTAAAACLCPMADADADTRPNVLLVLTDQSDTTQQRTEGPRSKRRRSIGSRARASASSRRSHRSVSARARSRVVTDRPVPHGHGMLNNCHEPDAIRANLPADLSTFSEELVAAGYDLTYTGSGTPAATRPRRFRVLVSRGQRQTPRRHRRGVPQYREERGVPVGEADLEEEIYTGEEPRDGSAGTFVAAKRPSMSRVREPTFSPNGRSTRSNRTRTATETVRSSTGRTSTGPTTPTSSRNPTPSMYDPDEIEPPRATPRPTTGSHRSTRTASPTAASPASTGISGPEALAKYWGSSR